MLNQGTHVMDSPPLVVVFGSAGTIGAPLCTYLRKAGIQVMGVPRSQCDLLDPRATRQLVEGLPAQATLVFTSVINRWKEDSFDAMAKNLAMVENVALSAHGRIRAMVYLSSVDVYGRFPRLPIHEGSSILPESYYALAKFSGERLMIRSLQPACPVSVLRLPGVYGMGPGERSVLGSFLEKVMNRAPITIYGDGSILRDFVFVDDVCEIIRRLVLQPRPGIFNLATGTSLPLLEVLATLGRVLERRPDLHFAPPQGDSAGDLVFDTTGLELAFPGWTATPLTVGAGLLAARIQG